MKNSPPFNIKFVTLVGKYPCLYDYTIPDYSKKHIHDKAWETIANEVSATVNECKQRWKNLRGCYTRHLKSVATLSASDSAKKNPYYLAEYLDFLQPFTKSRDFTRGEEFTCESMTSSPETEEEQDDDNMSDKETEYEERKSYKHAKLEVLSDVGSESQQNNFTILAPKRQKRNFEDPIFVTEVDNSPLQYFEPKKIQENTDTKTDDPDLAFLKSVLPDMREMNSNQKRRFKIGILSLAGQILHANQ